NEVYERYFEKIKPARSTVAVNALPGEVKIEIDLVAYSKVNK
ncbi:MAG TPA: RidA family protein, partial [Deltaproteobacteria bacterium]|nr:RidA family protein [Deltaproteobacteria bacterium]